MTCRFETILNDLQVALGETPGLPALLTGEELPEDWVGNNLQLLVGRFAPGVAMKLFINSEITLLRDVMQPIESMPVKAGDDSALIPLPSDFLRLGAIRMADWEREVEALTPIDSLRSRIGVIPGVLRRVCSPRFPIVGVRCDNSGRYLEVRGTSSPETPPQTALYVAVPIWQRSEYGVRYMDIPEVLYSEFIAGLTRIAVSADER